MRSSEIQKDFYYCKIGINDLQKTMKYKESDKIRKKKLNRLLKGIKGKKVLNIGCGTEEFLDETFCKNNKVFGLDISIENLKEAKTNNHTPVLCDLEI